MLQFSDKMVESGQSLLVSMVRILRKIRIERNLKYVWLLHINNSHRLNIYNELIVTADEAKKIISGFKDPNAIRGSGIFLNGVKYLTLKADDRSIYGKKVFEINFLTNYQLTKGCNWMYMCENFKGCFDWCLHWTNSTWSRSHHSWKISWLPHRKQLLIYHNKVPCIVMKRFLSFFVLLHFHTRDFSQNFLWVTCKGSYSQTYSHFITSEVLLTIKS